MGVVYRQKGRSTWMLKYYRDGRAIYESSGTDIKDEATTILKKREGAIAHGLPVSNRTGKLRFDDAADDLITDYKVNNRRSLDVLERRIRLHLLPFFGNRKLSTITTPLVRAYIAHRQEHGIVATRGPRGGERIGDVSNAEINRELTALKRMFTLAMQAGQILHRPHIPMLAEDNVRTGFSSGISSTRCGSIYQRRCDPSSRSPTSLAGASIAKCFLCNGGISTFLPGRSA